MRLLTEMLSLLLFMLSPGCAYRAKVSGCICPGPNAPVTLVLLFCPEFDSCPYMAFQIVSGSTLSSAHSRHLSLLRLRHRININPAFRLIILYLVKELLLLVGRDC